MTILKLDHNWTIDRLPALIQRLSPDWNDPFLDRIVLDLSGAVFLPPSALTTIATVGMLAQASGIQLDVVRPLNPDTQSYLARMDFFDLLGAQVDYGYHRHDGSGRFREFVQVQTERDGDKIVEQLVCILREQMDIQGVLQAVSHAFAEVVNNVFHHAQSPTKAVISAQAYGKRHAVELTVVDSGRGIPNSLRGNPTLTFTTHAEALQLAISQRVTGRPGMNTGEGLFFTSEFLKANGGEGWIYSQDAAVHIHDGQVEFRSGLPCWGGTIVALRFLTNRPVNTQAIFNLFAPPEDEFNWLFEG